METGKSGGQGWWWGGGKNGHNLMPVIKGRRAANVKREREREREETRRRKKHQASRWQVLLWQ